ncbi:30S ribosomal protein S19e [archaeon]|nr:30S ribosomal protein S19e [archaeon]MBL7057304.1 30S ribosomal protein S19e [Candidatus Woesearchaeota archaeon]
MLYDVPQNELIEKTATELKKLIHMPSWAPFVKTGTHKQRPPIDPDWWYVRAAAILRKIYLRGPVGVSKLKVQYGGKKNRGVRPEKFCKGSGSVIRKVLQQLEEAKLIKQEAVGKHKGRVITPKGKSVLFSVAKSIGKVAPAPKKVAPKKEAPIKDAGVPKVEAKKDVPKVEAKKEAPKPDAKQDYVIPKEEQLMKMPKGKEEKKDAPVKEEVSKK